MTPGAQNRPPSAGREASWARSASLALAAAFVAAVPLSASADCDSLTVSATAVAFGAFSGPAKASTGTISATCRGEDSQSYTVSLSTGNSGTYSSRSLRNGTNSLSYNLFTTSACTQIWGNNTGGSVRVSGSFNIPSSSSQQTRQHTVFGCLPAQAVPVPGTYTDTIIVTVTW